MSYLLFSTLTPANPYNPPPAGWVKPTSANNIRIVDISGNILFGRSSGTDYAIWYDQNALGAPTIGSKTIVGNASATTNGGSCVVEGLNGNGYAVTHSNFGGTIDLIKLTASAKDGASLLSVTSSSVNYTTEIEIRFIKATSTLQMYKNGVQIGTDVVDTSYDPIHAGVCAGGGLSLSVETYQIGVEVTALTDPIVLGSPITWDSTFTNPITSISAIGLSATNIDNVGEGADWPALADGQVITQSLPTGSTPVLFGDGTETASRNASFNLSADYTSLAIAAPNNSNSNYIGSQYPLTAGWFFYWEEDQPTGNIILYSDGRISVSAAGEYVVFVHEYVAGVGGPVVELTINVNSGGEIVGGGLTAVGLTSRGLVARGLVARGL